MQEEPSIFIASAKKTIPVIDKNEPEKKENKSSKTIQEQDREKLEKKFSNKKKTFN